MPTVFALIRRVALTLGMLASMQAILLAHAPSLGPNGGQRVDAGNLHAELLTNGSNSVVLFLSGPKYEAVSSKDFKANAILIIDGKPQRFPLTPSEPDKLTGTAAMPVPAAVKGVIQISGPDGTTYQAKY